MVIVRTAGDYLFPGNILPFKEIIWSDVIEIFKVGSGICLSVAMAALGLSTRLNELRAMGLKPFVAGLTAAFTVGIVSFITIHVFIALQLI